MHQVDPDKKAKQLSKYQVSVPPLVPYKVTWTSEGILEIFSANNNNSKGYTSEETFHPNIAKVARIGRAFRINQEISSKKDRYIAYQHSYDYFLPYYRLWSEKLLTKFEFRGDVEILPFPVMFGEAHRCNL